MDEIEIVIKIKRQEWERLNKLFKKGKKLGKYKSSIGNGKPIPQGHGDLIDRNELFEKKYSIFDEWKGYEINIIEAIEVAMANTILEADKEIKE